VLEVAHAGSEAAPELGESLGAKQEQDDEEQEEEVNGIFEATEHEGF
jgi:hypothetical protein